MNTEVAQIPTYPDLLHQITASIAEGLDNDTAADAIADVLMDGSISLADRPFQLIAHARGCHAAADVRRREGNHDAAAGLYDLGQFLLEAASQAHAELIAAIGTIDLKH
ncbi:hypothetical protein [Mesorhizobium sp. L-8-3]|uniref:hypothetical protein n=1 Tax=Mesorhizobium sp. L-8-3 TaxID=2744522 RepID=UPI0019281D53|nr:hypothetical protein [Mesorhizobium sp. L-8-3]BCH22088.1 hypothetical protein MesoLjLb_18730 [Mesorhizobium sp. L-8-3]